jgi:hypothetical protein
MKVYNPDGKWSELLVIYSSYGYLFVIFFSDVIPPAMLLIKPTTSVAIFLMPACFDSS